MSTKRGGNGGSRPDGNFRPVAFLPTAWPHYTFLLLSMVRSTTIARASDALPLAASVDDEQVGRLVGCVPSVSECAHPRHCRPKMSSRSTSNKPN